MLWIPPKHLDTNISSGQIEFSTTHREIPDDLGYSSVLNQDLNRVQHGIRDPKHINLPGVEILSA